MTTGQAGEGATNAWEIIGAELGRLGIRWYILDGETVRQVGLAEHCQFFLLADQPWRIGSTYVDDIWISTVFLRAAIDWPGCQIMHFETMAFRGDRDGCMRYSTLEDAIAGHAAAVRLAQTLQREAGLPGMLSMRPKG